MSFRTQVLSLFRAIFYLSYPLQISLVLAVLALYVRHDLEDIPEVLSFFC
jgi:hypothetical protein